MLNLPSFMELKPYPYEYDQPTTEKEDVLDVLFGRKARDGLGRTYDDLVNSSEMIYLYQAIADNYEAEKALFRLLGQHWDDLNKSLKDVIEAQAQIAAEEW